MRTCKPEFTEKFKTKNRAIDIIKGVVVTRQNFKEIKGMVSPELHRQISLGDNISIILFCDNGNGHHGLVTIWHNKSFAAIKTTTKINHVGEWDERNRVLVTEQKEQAWTTYGEELSGHVAFDIYGYAGIFASGQFFRAQG